MKLYPLNEEEMALVNAYRLLTSLQRQTYRESMISVAHQAAPPILEGDNVIRLHQLAASAV